MQEEVDVGALLEAALGGGSGAGEALYALGQVGGRNIARRLLPLLQSQDVGLARDAAMSLRGIGSPVAVKPLLEMARGRGELEARWWGAYALSFVWGPGWHPRAAMARREGLLEVAQDSKEAPSVRAQALEGLAGEVEALKVNTSARKRVARVVCEGLRDADAEIRFWACFAAMGLREGGIKEALEALRGDEVRVPTMWSVGAEAQDALRWGRHGELGDHPMLPVGTWHEGASSYRGFVTASEAQGWFGALEARLVGDMPEAAVEPWEVEDARGEVWAQLRTPKARWEGVMGRLAGLGFESEARWDASGAVVGARGWLCAGAAARFLARVRLVADAETEGLL
jgi:hypothetical protein